MFSGVHFVTKTNHIFNIRLLFLKLFFKYLDLILEKMAPERLGVSKEFLLETAKKDFSPGLLQKSFLC
jgi:hypothetical protein